MNTNSKPTFLLNIFHVLIDGLFESVPLLLSFMAIAWGSGEKEVGLIISLAVMASTLTGLATKPLSRRFGRLTALIWITALYGAGFFMNAFSANLYFAGGCFILPDTPSFTVFPFRIYPPPPTGPSWEPPSAISRRSATSAESRSRR